MITNNDLFIDLETYCEKNLKKCGLRAYIEDPSFEILLFSYAFGADDVKCIDIASGETVPDHVLNALKDPNITIHAHNAAFERLALSKEFGHIPISRFSCSMIKVAYCGLPLSLDASAKALETDHQKLKSGTLLIKYFSEPCKPAASNGYRSRNMPWHALEKWEEYKHYNIVDVDTERDNILMLGSIEIPPFEKELYILDQEINDRGIKIDPIMAAHASVMADAFKKDKKTELQDLSDIDNIGSQAQIKEWLKQELSEDELEAFPKHKVTGDLSLLKGDVKDALKIIKNPKAIELLEGRLVVSKSSNAKYDAMLSCISDDSRIRGLFQLYGANRTGRWAGRMVQLQNLPQNHIDDLDLARNLVLNGDLDGMEMMYGNVADTLSQLIRTTFIPEEGKIFAVADFSAIEARVTARLANEQWRLDVFNTHGKIYEASAAMMFGVPIESITKGSMERQKGKYAELALGYGGSVQAFLNFGADKFMTQPEMRSTVKLWRKANPNIVEGWSELENCAIEAVVYREPVVSKLWGLKFEVIEDWLAVTLPSGRNLMYYKPRLKNGKFGNKHALAYLGTDNTSNMCVVDTYGGKLMENVVQAISRDILAVAMVRVNKAGYPIVLHVHDELAAEVPIETSEQDLKIIEDIMAMPIDWADGLPSRADGYLTPYYKKD